MKFLILSGLVFFGTVNTALALDKMPDGTYKCSIYQSGKAKNEITFTFKMKNDEVQCATGTNDECESWFTFAPATQTTFWLDGLYDGGYEYSEEGNWQVDADSDGCNVANLTLYKDSDFTKGFIKTKFNCSGTQYPGGVGRVYCER